MDRKKVNICVQFFYLNWNKISKKYIFFQYQKGDNFIGEIYRILYKDANDSENKNKSSLILKIAPSNLLRREKMKLRSLFMREINMYDQVRIIF